MSADPSIATPQRTRNAAATRAAILASARAAFARAGYDGAGVREIAAGAGVTAMLVNRYFGSKEKLFAEVCADTMREPVILSPENLAAPDFAAAFAKALVQVTAPGATPLDGFLILLHSASSPRAAEIGREWVGKGHQSTLEAAIAGPLAKERAAVALALVAGMQVMRQMMEIEALAGAAPTELEEVLTPVVRALFETGTPGS
ncbi:TetR/AcrR family transcriptional regulator [Phenylobacterium aquaticum]|uniref:TetR/AcrR family transcriptional regulator n=1 Tax=Phenylobacterium aquaticum TaxID=1763816 RepID=UPI0026EB5279|nr:TetR/AcrR family transcriptional regulator [Phenylobacterium aquaticum]